MAIGSSALKIINGEYLFSLKKIMVVDFFSLKNNQWQLALQP